MSERLEIVVDVLENGVCVVRKMPTADWIVFATPEEILARKVASTEPLYVPERHSENDE